MSSATSWILLLFLLLQLHSVWW